MLLAEADFIITEDTGGMVNILMIALLAMLLISGVYGLYTLIRLRRTLLLFPNKFLYPGNCSHENCIDEDGFIDFILPRLTVLSVVSLVLSLAFAAWIFLFPQVQHWVLDLAVLILPCGVYFWYMFVQKKAAKEFWGL